MNRLKKNMERLEEFNMLRVKLFMTKERFKKEDEQNG